MKTALGVIPGTKVSFLEEASAYKFADKYHHCVDTSADNGRCFTKELKYRCEKTDASVDREYPQRSLALQGLIAFPIRGKGRKYDFDIPAGKAAF